MSVMYKAICLDLDGTLLNSSKTIGARTIEAIRKVAAKGIAIVLASGRMTPCVEPYQAVLGVDCHLVSYNGGAGYDTKKNGRKCLFEKPLDISLSSKILEYAMKENWATNLYIKDQLIAVSKSKSHQDLYDRYVNVTAASYKYIDSYTSVLDQPTSKLILLAEDDHVPALMKTFRQRFTPDQAHIIPVDFFIEFVDPKVNKGTGVENLMKALSIPMEQVVAFGDGHNDVEMLQMVGLGVAMQNAEDTAKKVANKVSQFTNDEDAVGRELESIFGL